MTPKKQRGNWKELGAKISTTLFFLMPGDILDIMNLNWEKVMIWPVSTKKGRFFRNRLDVSEGKREHTKILTKRNMTKWAKKGKNVIQSYILLSTPEHDLYPSPIINTFSLWWFTFQMVHTGFYLKKNRINCQINKQAHLNPIIASQKNVDCSPYLVSLWPA